MNTKNLFRRVLCCLLLLAMLAGYFPTGVLEVKATEDTSSLSEEKTETRDTSLSEELSVPTYPQLASYYAIAENPMQSETYLMGGMSLVKHYAYFIRTTTDKSTAILYRTNLKTKSSAKVTFNEPNRLGEGKAMTTAETENGSYLIIATGKTGANALLLAPVDTGKMTVDLAGGYTLKTADNTELCADSVTVLSVDGTTANLLIRSGYKFYTAAINTSNTGDGTLVATASFTIDPTATRTKIMELCDAPVAVKNTENGDNIGALYFGIEYVPSLDRLYMGVSVNCSTGILVYSNVTDLISEKTQSANADLNLSIPVASSGYTYHRICDIAISRGMVFFSSEGLRLTGTNPRGNICHLLDTPSDTMNKIQGFHQSGTYRVAGETTPNHVFVCYKDNTTGEHKIKIEVTTSTEDAYRMGFESDAQGYWYIRCGVGISGVAKVANLYLTAGEDGSVTLQPKDPGNPNQMWYLRYTKMNGTDKLYAIHSKATGLYLGNDKTDIYKIITRTEGKTFVLQQVKDTAALKSYLFDYEFYKMAYPNEVGNKTADEALSYFESTGKAAGHIASPYFDPEYYLANNADVKKNNKYNTPKGAFDHFVNYGFWEGRQGSIFFSAAEYASGTKNQDIYDTYFPEKEWILYNYDKYGVNEASYKYYRQGSDEFSLQEYAEEFYLSVSTDSEDNIGKNLLRNYLASLIRMKNCTTIEEFYTLIYDEDVYKYLNRTDLTLTKLENANIGGSGYSAKLKRHWDVHGRSGGRTPGYLFVPSYYATRYHDKGVTLANAYEHYFNTGRAEGLVGSPYVSMSTAEDIPCNHSYTATAYDTYCTQTCKKTTFCALCRDVINQVEFPALSHKDSDGNTKCDLCNNSITDILNDQNELLGLELPGYDNELVTDTSNFQKNSNTKSPGMYYLVQKGSDGIYRVFDPMSQSLYGTIAATQVSEAGGRIVGADPDMALDVRFSEDQKLDNPNPDKNTNHYNFGMEDEYYLYIEAEPTRIKRADGSAYRNIGVGTAKSDTTIYLYRSLNIYDPAKNLSSDSKVTLTYYLGHEIMNGSDYFEWTMQYGNQSHDDNFYLYKLAEDRLHTDGIYEALQRAVTYLPQNGNYDNTVYKRFCALVDDLKNDYLKYNNVTLSGTDLTNREDLQNALDQKERELLDLMGILEINRQGKTISYFPANMYEWDEDGINALVAQMNDAETKGFFFEAGKNVTGTSPFSVYDKNTKEEIDGVSTYAQMYSIYSGLVEKILSDSNNPPFNNQNVVAADMWSETPIKNVKNVYTAVGVPFVYKDGYYTLDSDQNGVFFEGEPTSGTNLAILEKPISYHWHSGSTNGAGVPGYQQETKYSYQMYNNYVTGFQPFADVTEFSGKSYSAKASTSNYVAPVDTYIMDGVSHISDKNDAVDTTGRGDPEWGFGMRLDIKFNMTENGCIYDTNGNETPITFNFSGDDDVWVYIDGKLVMELGGSHDAIQGEINFATGDVIVSSEKYGRIRDKNPNGYGRGSDANQYGSNNVTAAGSILTRNMYQKNIYEKVFETTVSKFAAGGERTLTVFYMDRGKGRTNCAISFNLPQNDIVVVEKDIADTYAGVVDPATGKEMPISQATMDYLSTLDYGFTLFENNEPVARQLFYIYDENGALLGTRETDRLGHFTLKNGQRAEFRNLQFTGQSYYVTEDDLNSRWSDPTWSGDTNGEPISSQTGYTAPNQGMTGGPYSVEIIRFVCTNHYSYYPELLPEIQYVVPDYGKPIDIMIIDNAVFKGLSEEVVRGGIIKKRYAPTESEMAAGIVSYGSYYSSSIIEDRFIRIFPKKMLTEECRMYADVEITLDDASVRTATITIKIAPATIMYYESDFLEGMENAKTVFTYTTSGTTDSKHQWTDKDSTGKDTIQDNGVPGDEVYNLVIDKEAIPSNAFFADFDGEGYAERYSVDALYKGYDYDAYYADSMQAYAWLVNEANSSVATIDPNKGTLSFTMKKEKTSAFVQTGFTTEIENSTLNLIPVPNSFAQIRLKLKNFKSDGSGPKPQVRIYYYDPDSTSSFNDQIQFDYVQIPEEYLNSDAYFTVKIPLTEKYEAEPYIDRLRVQLFYTENISDTETGIFTLDYVYVGPEFGFKENVDSEYLYFGFDGTEGDILRYSAGIYGDQNLNYDSDDGPWASSHAFKSMTNTHVIDNHEGALSMDIAEGYINYANNCGPRFMISNNGQYPVSGDPAQPEPGLSPLCFDARNAEYVQIRFKLVNCTFSSADTYKKICVLYNYKDASGAEKYDYRIYGEYDADSEEYQTVRIPIPKDSKMKTEAVTITSIGLRFRGLMGKTGGGKVIIDEIFLGTEEAMLRLDESSHNLFFDFNNTEEDHIRYSTDFYGGYNYDDPDVRHWAMSYGAEITTGLGAEEGTSSTANHYEIANGVASLTIPYPPHHTQTRFGTTAVATPKNDATKPSGYYPWHETPERIPLNFPAKYAEYVQVKFRVEDCIASDGKAPNVGVIFYCLEQDGKTKYKIYDSDNYKIADGYITLRFKTENKEHGRLQDVETILAVSVIFRNIQAETQNSTTAKVHLDYLYIGEMVQANPAARSLYYSFENTESDRERYDSDAYGYINADDEVTVHWWDNDGTHTPNDTTDGKSESFTIDNASGTGVIVALPSAAELTTRWPDFYIDTSITGGNHKNPLDFKPQDAEIYQVRFKVEGFGVGRCLDKTTGNEKTVNPYVNLQWEVAGSQTSQTLSTASKVVEYDLSYLETGEWVTVTCKIPESARNADAIQSVRAYFAGLTNLEGKQGKITIDYIYIGPDDRPDQVYGYDSHYNNDPVYSDGHSKFVEGAGVKLQNNTTYTELSFPFKGTGFDLISRTGPSQATIRVEVTKKGEAEPLKKLTINNKGQLELYQIPVVSVQGLDYGEYNVTLWVNKAVNSQYEVLNRGGEFYFDAVRIYDPMGTDDASYYKADREAYNFIKEIRNILLDKETFENLSDATEETIEGAVFVDVNSHLVQPDGSLPNDPEAGVSDQFTTVDVATYNGIGPKNEVYLAPGQAVAFNLKVSTNRNITSLDIGAKTIVSGKANLKIGILAKDAKGDFTIATDRSYTISSATAQYLEMDLTNVQVKSDSDSKYQPMYLVFYNISAPGTASTAESPNANGVISLTDVKVAYNANPDQAQNVPGDTITDPEIDPDLKPDGKNAGEAPIQMLVDGDTLPATKYFVNAVNETPILEENATIRHTLNLASDISLNYLVATSELSGYDSFYMQCVIPVYNGNAYVGTKVVKLSPVLKGNYYYFTLEGLTAVHMMDVIEAKLVMTADGRSYYSETDSYSIAKYAYAQLAKEGNTTQLKQLCADLLRYGAKAQIHKGYRTDRLADREMTADQKAYLTDLDSVTFGNTNRVLEDLKKPSILWVGKALNLESKVSLKFVFSMATYEGKADDLSLRVSYKDATGAEKTLTLSGAQEYNKTLGYYAFTVDSLLAAELRSVVSVQIYHGEAPLSCTMQYSADTYGAGKTGTLLDLCKALFAYSDSAKAYFG